MTSRRAELSDGDLSREAQAGWQNENEEYPTQHRCHRRGGCFCKAARLALNGEIAQFNSTQSSIR